MQARLSVLIRIGRSALLQRGALGRAACRREGRGIDPMTEKDYAGKMTRQDQRAYVRRWVETGQMLEEIRWRELRALDAAAAMGASGHLIEAALLVPLSSGRREWSGLVDLQDLLRRLRYQ